jgi:hypothetical protein
MLRRPWSRGEEEYRPPVMEGGSWSSLSSWSRRASHWSVWSVVMVSSTTVEGPEEEREGPAKQRNERADSDRHSASIGADAVLHTWPSHELLITLVVPSDDGTWPDEAMHG